MSRGSLTISKIVEEELEYLRWWYQEADFGPADGDVRSIMNEEYTRETGRPVPDGYEDE